MRSDENELMCRIEPGNPMHDAFKRYWLVAGLSDDLPEPDCDPRRSTMLGEDYVLFRDSEGKVGCLRELCCHRGASLCLGRVEQGGIRCIFHGWKFDVDGKIMDMPNATGDRFKKMYRQPSFPVVEKGGMIWVYLGDEDKKPPLPDYHFLHLTERQRFVSPVVFHSNYTQAVDGGVDLSHLTTLHQDAFVRQAAVLDKDGLDRIMADTAPRVDSQPTEFGQFSVAIRKVVDADGQTAETCRLSAFFAPSTFLVTSSGAKPHAGIFGISTPVNDYKTILYIGIFDADWTTPEEPLEAQRFMSVDKETLDSLGFSRETCDKMDRASRINNWLQKRDSMREGSWTGIPPFLPEDVVVSESMGAIYDRSEESPVPADKVVVDARRILINIAKDVQAGKDPVGVRSPVDTSNIYCHEKVIPPGERWQDVMLPDAFVTKTPATQSPENTADGEAAETEKSAV